MTWPVQCRGWETSCFLLSLNSSNLFIYHLCCSRSQGDVIEWALAVRSPIRYKNISHAWERKTYSVSASLLEVSVEIGSGVASLCKPMAVWWEHFSTRNPALGAFFQKGAKHLSVASCIWASCLDWIWTDNLTLKDCTSYNQFSELPFPSMLKDNLD